MLVALRKKLSKYSGYTPVEHSPIDTPIADSHPDYGSIPNETAQDGAQEAIPATWSKTSLGLAYTLMWLLYFVNAFQSSITGNLSAFVTSGFASHSLVPVIYILSSVMSATTYMPLAKILNLWDRSIGFLLMAAFATIGLVLSATCDSIQTYAASQVFYVIGFSGIIFSIDVITADTSTARDRGLAYAFTSSPYIITAFAGSAASEHFHETNWRWAYGYFAIILPLLALPMFALLRYNRHQAKTLGLLPEERRSDRTIMQSFVHYIIEFDLLGVFLLAAGLVLTLLPFTLAGTMDDDWRSPSIITMLAAGIVFLLTFILTECFLVPVPFLQWHLLTSRTMIGVCLLSISYQIAYYCWDDYYTSYLQVVYGTSIATAGYISSIFDVVSGVWLFVVGFLIKRTSRFRWLLLWAVPLYMLGVLLMIYFRNPRWSVGYSILCQIFIAFGGSTMVIVQQIAVLSSSKHNDIASALAFLSVFGSVGSAIGSSISGAIWTHTLPNALKRLLPESAKPDWKLIYESLDIQLSYPQGSPVRHAIAIAYGETQTKMLVAGTAVMALSLGWMFLIRDVKLSSKDKGAVLF